MTDVITMTDMLTCAERELKMRKSVYPRWVENGKLSAGKATHEITCMEAIAKHFQELAAKERLI